MLIKDEIEYYRSRELSERVAIEQALCPASKNAHCEMAERYADQIGALEDQQHSAQHP